MRWSRDGLEVNQMFPMLLRRRQGADLVLLHELTIILHIILDFNLPPKLKSLNHIHIKSAALTIPASRSAQAQEHDLLSASPSTLFSYHVQISS